MPSKKELQEQIIEMWSKSFTELHIEVNKWYLTWKFPFIRKFEFHGTAKELQELENILFNKYLANRMLMMLPPINIKDKHTEGFKKK